MCKIPFPGGCILYCDAPENASIFLQIFCKFFTPGKVYCDCKFSIAVLYCRNDEFITIPEDNRI